MEIVQKILGMIAMDPNKHAKIIAKHLAQVLLYDEQVPSRKLYPTVREKYYKLWDIMKAKGMQIKLVETFRTVPRQNSLSSDVTNAGGLQSYHQFSLAFDVFFVGYRYNPPSENWWDILGEEGERLGLIWGGRWPSEDTPHFEWHDGFTWEDLKPYLEKV
jgi:hypothetical protein